MGLVDHFSHVSLMTKTKQNKISFIIYSNVWKNLARQLVIFSKKERKKKRKDLIKFKLSQRLNSISFSPKVCVCGQIGKKQDLLFGMGSITKIIEKWRSAIFPYFPGQIWCQIWMSWDYMWNSYLCSSVYQNLELKFSRSIFNTGARRFWFRKDNVIWHLH